MLNKAHLMMLGLIIFVEHPKKVPIELELKHLFLLPAVNPPVSVSLSALIAGLS